MHLKPFLIFVILSLASAKDGWVCKDGFWYENGVKSKWECKDESDDTTEKGKKQAGCTRSSDPNMPSHYPKTCIYAPPDNGIRCWWTHTPAVLSSDASSLKVPLVIDMHGGGGCASHQMSTSGFKVMLWQPNVPIHM